MSSKYDVDERVWELYDGFHNDTTPRYDEKAAEIAWSRTVEFFDKHLKSDG